MVRRGLDIFFQYLGRLLLGMLLVPAVVGVAGLLLTRSEVVTARLWADNPAATTVDPTAADFAASESPAQRQAALLSELLHSDSFMSKVFRAKPLSGAVSGDRERQLVQTARANLDVQPLGSNVVAITFVTSRPDEGVALVTAVITAYGQALTQMQGLQSEAALSSLNKQLAGTNQAMDLAVAKVQNYAATRHLNPGTSVADPTYQSLTDDAQRKTNAYLDLVNRIQQQQALEASGSDVQHSLYQVLDSPTAAPQPLDGHTPTVRFTSYAVGAVLAVEIAFVYMTARRDPRIRTATEVARSLDIRAIGAVPAPRAH
jgi:capsular polysaccharide biosynthesis protein